MKRFLAPIFVLIALSASAQVTIYSEDFEGQPTALISTTTGSSLHQQGSQTCSPEAMWNVVDLTTYESTYSIECAGCIGNWAEIKYTATCASDEYMYTAEWVPGGTDINISFDWRFRYYLDAIELFEADLYNVTDGTVVTNLVSQSGASDDQTYSSSYTLTGANAPTDTYVLRFRYRGDYDYGATVDNILVSVNCNAPTVTYTIDDTACSSGQFTIDVNVTALGDGSAVDVTDGGLTAGLTNQGVGSYTMGPYAAGTNVTISVDGTSYSGCATTSGVLTEACACTTVPTATVNETNIDCGTSTYDIEVTVTNFGDGTSADIYIGGSLVQSNAVLSNTYTFSGYAIGTHSVEVRASGGAFVSCIYTESAIASCNNDDCSDAITLSPNASLGCTLYAAGNTDGQTESLTACAGSGGTADDDIWYKFTATSTEHNITLFDIANVTGTSQYMSMEVFAGSCGGSSIYCDNGDEAALTGLTVGVTYYIRVFTYSSFSTVTLNICVGTPNTPAPPCNAAIPNPDDNCTNATLIDSFDGYCGTTLGTYTVDFPAASPDDEPCGNIENNSWFQFEAAETQVQIEWWVPSSATCDDGVQFSVYEGTCGSLSMLAGSCENWAGPSGSGENGLYTFSGLTVGNTYYIMIDGFAGDVCDYTWAAASGVVLPTRLTSFSVEDQEGVNVVKWSTAMEEDSKQFIVEKSVDGKRFEPIGTRGGHGTTSDINNYAFYDYDVEYNVAYYRLQQLSYNNKKRYSEIVKVVRDVDGFNVRDIYPNPTRRMINIEYINAVDEDLDVAIYDLNGQLVKHDSFEYLGINGKLSMNIEELPQGIYIVKINNSIQHSITKKIVVVD